MLPEIGVILDAGTGIFRARDLIQTRTLDIFLTHVHLDHCIGLTYLYDVLYQKNLERVTVHVAAEKFDSIQQHLYAVDLFPVKPNFELRPLKIAGPIRLADGCQLTAFPVEHPGGCYAFRMDGLPGDRSLAYVTDTTADLAASYVAQIRHVNTLIHECYFPDGWEEKAILTGHSCLTPVAQVARATNVQRCYLVHVNPLDESHSPLDLDSVQDIFESITVAFDQLVIDV